MKTKVSGEDIARWIYAPRNRSDVHLRPRHCDIPPLLAALSAECLEPVEKHQDERDIKSRGGSD